MLMLMLLLILPLLSSIYYLCVMMLDGHLLAAQYTTLCSLACSTPCSTRPPSLVYNLDSQLSKSETVFGALTSQLFAPSLRLRLRWPSPSRPTLVDGSTHTFPSPQYTYDALLKVYDPFSRCPRRCWPRRYVPTRECPPGNGPAPRSPRGSHPTRT